MAGKQISSRIFSILAARGSRSFSSDVPTHTGQKFDEDDYRLVRFEGKEKMVNKQFAIDLIAKVPPAVTKERVVWCDGGGGPTGHPKVYINLDKPGNHSCGYCGLRFYKEDHHH
ncbi:NADH dehydrogenase [ubiquinone] iron-sulfur protein 6, mitochondrial [Halyomorpha halys]|uniref:NADH dehydrogenase [ubiquinone] iron-sulfur protein 6, mitochondrial n=1 Tax=Halyomorpha halys TaxID=286706 RepID=UPI0006D4D4E9|nr:NADH dehydrogenase [ubiquinone] iron-sulfur protein 6, mitochondrial [Halyomorpha halys]